MSRTPVPTSFSYDIAQPIGDFLSGLCFSPAGTFIPSNSRPPRGSYYGTHSNSSLTSLLFRTCFPHSPSAISVIQINSRALAACSVASNPTRVNRGLCGLTRLNRVKVWFVHRNMPSTSRLNCCMRLYWTFISTLPGI